MNYQQQSDQKYKWLIFKITYKQITSLLISPFQYSQKHTPKKKKNKEK